MGNNTFSAMPVFSNAQGANAVMAADVDGDGAIDVVSASSSDISIQWHRNNGNATFTTGTILVSSSVTQVSCLYLADVDNDGQLDVTISANQNVVYWHRNDGQGLFEARASLALGGRGHCASCHSGRCGWRWCYGHRRLGRIPTSRGFRTRSTWSSMAPWSSPRPGVVARWWQRISMASPRSRERVH